MVPLLNGFFFMLDMEEIDNFKNKMLTRKEHINTCTDTTLARALYVHDWKRHNRDNPKSTDRHVMEQPSSTTKDPQPEDRDMDWE